MPADGQSVLYHFNQFLKLLIAFFKSSTERVMLPVLLSSGGIGGRIVFRWGDECFFFSSSTISGVHFRTEQSHDITRTVSLISPVAILEETNDATEHFDIGFCVDVVWAILWFSIKSRIWRFTVVASDFYFFPPWTGQASSSEAVQLSPCRQAVFQHDPGEPPPVNSLAEFILAALGIRFKTTF